MPMLRLTLVPQVQGLSTVDASVVFGPDATVADLALATTDHFRSIGELAERSGFSGTAVLAPVAPSGQWPAGLRLADAGLRSGAALAVVVVDQSWFEPSNDAARPLAIAHVAAGRSSGAEFALHHDTARIGRDPSCEICLDDPLVSRLHARVRLADPPEVQDEGSANGTQIDGLEVTGTTTLGWRQRLTVGDSEIWFEPLGQPNAAADTLSSAGAVAVLRPPRLEAKFESRQLRIASPPQRPTPQPVPWLTSALPLLMGAVLWVVTKSVLAVIFTALSPMLFIGTWWESKRAAERYYQQQLERHHRHVGEQIGNLLIDQQLEREYLLGEFPEPADLLRLVTSRAPRLWARQPRDDDFLDVRVGIGSKTSASELVVEQGGEPDDLDKLNKEVEQHRVVADVPILVKLMTARSLAVVAPRSSGDGELRTVLLQLAIDQSPADVEFVGVLGPARAGHIDWLKWLPHATGEFTRHEHPFAIGAGEGRQLIDRLIESATSTPGPEDRKVHTVVLIDEDANLPRDLVERLLAVGRDAPVLLIWVGARRDTVPTSIAAVLDTLSAPAPSLAHGQVQLPGAEAPSEMGTLWSALRTPPSKAIRPDRLGQPAAVAAARSLAACVDVSATVPQSQALPETVRLPNLMADLAGPDDVGTVVQRWSQSRGLRGQVGMGVEGTFTLDIRADGPHGLVAGTTGAGKSELLQTLILSLAVNNPPNRLTFLLVDYKGGAAFKECGELPHTVGYITDLTTNLVNRVLTSLDAEITKREHALDRYGAKNLVDLEAAYPEASPPSLLIVVDEFAALAAEVPDFVNGMVNIAQRGRSLGMHMILATQRPQGVITENIRANTDLRIALRVAADADSQDVIGVADAAHISRRTPGRAWIRRIGQGEATPVQAAFVGARKHAGQVDPPVELHEFVVRSSQAHNRAPAEDTSTSAATDLERLVAAVNRASEQTAITAGPPPWVKELGSLVTFSPLGHGVIEIVDSTEGAKNVLAPMSAATGDASVPIGLVDEPLLQRQSPISLDYRGKGSFLVFGTSGSGKTELLRSIALSLSIPSADPPPAIYVIDFAGRGLGSLEALDNLGTMVFDNDHPRLFRLLRWLQQTIAGRLVAQSDAGVGDIDAQRRQTGEAIPRIHVLFDGFVTFLGAMEQAGRAGRRYVDLLVELIQSGRRTGVHFTFAAAQRTGIESALVTAIQGRVVMRLTTPEEYSYFGLPVGAIATDDPAGRCYVDGAPTQVMTIGDPGETNQRRRIEALAASLPRIESPHRVDSMPSHVPPGEDGLYAPRQLVVGVDFDQLEPAVVNLGTSCFFIGGRSLSGKSSVLAGIAANAAKSATPPRLLLLGHRAGELVDRAPWAEMHETPQQAFEALRALTAELETDSTGWTMVCIDDLHDWEDEASSTEGQYDFITQVKSLMDRRKQLGVSFLVSADTDVAKSSYSDTLDNLMRRDRLGLLLRPDYIDGSLLGTELPGTYEGRRVPARGFLCRQGQSRLTQAVSATPDGSTAPAQT